MSKHPWSVFIGVAIFILIVGLACSTGGTPATATPVPTNTSAPLPTAESKPTAELPKPALPTQGAAPVGPAPFEIDSNVYEHPSGAFFFNPPVGWTVSEGTGGVYILSPDEKAALDFYAMNAGYELDMAAFESSVLATEANYFGWRQDYEQLGYDFSADNGTALVAKRFSVDGVPQAVFTLYLLNGQGIFSFDFWAEEEVAQEYSDPYTELMSTINVNGANTATLPVYNLVTTFIDMNGLFQFDVPLAWTYSYSEDQDTYTDTFISPDGHGVMQNITYDDGTAISKSVAGAIALALLNQSYTGGAGDIKITADVGQADGSRRLDWTSKKGGYSGQSFYETRGTTFLMLSSLVDDGYEDLYGPVFDNTLSTYAVP